MRTSSAVKRDLSARKLSTVGPAKSGAAAGFDRTRLMRELLSLGNPKITSQVAQQIGEEVETELKRRAAPQISPELVSELVQFKLEELGLIEIRRRAAPRRAPTEDEPTVSLYPESEAGAPNLEGALAARFAATQLPTLEKFLRPAGATAAPLPPKAGLKLAAPLLRRLREAQGLDEAQASAQLEALLGTLAARAAEPERRFPRGKQAETLAVEFYNAMANQEFYPRDEALAAFATGQAPAPGEKPVVTLACTVGRTPLPSLRQAAEAQWRSGNEVTFALGDEDFVPEAAATLLRTLETALLALPEEVPFPAAITLRLALDHPQALAVATEALSGKYYPNFRFEWTVPSEDAALDTEARNQVLKVTWKKSEPRLIFVDEAQGASSHSRLSHLESGHSGGAPALSHREGGSLGSLNLSIAGTGSEVDWPKLRRMTRTAVHFLENLNLARDLQAPARLGVMGFADLLLKLGVPYDSDDAVVLAEKIFRFLRQECDQAAAALAQSREADPTSGGPLELARHDAIDLHLDSDAATADLAGVEAGLEPLHHVVEHGAPVPLLLQIAQRRKVWSEAIAAEVVAARSVRQAEGAPRPLRRLFGIAAELAPEWPLKVLGAAQRHSRHAVELEIPLEPGATLAELAAQVEARRQEGFRRFRIPENPEVPEAVETEAIDEFEYAAVEPLAAEASEASLLLTLEDLGTDADAEPVAEEACSEDPAEAPLETGVMAPEASAAEPVEAETAPAPVRPRPRPEVLQATTRFIQTGCGPLHVSFGRDAQGPYEVQAKPAGSGGCSHAQAETISRLLTLCLSSGIDQRLVYEQLRGVRCPTTAVDHGDLIESCSDGIARVFERELGFSREHEAAPEEEEITAVTSLQELN